MQFISVFSNIANLGEFQWKNADVSRIQEIYDVLIFFGSLFRYVLTVPSVTDIRERETFCPPSLSSHEKAHPARVNQLDHSRQTTVKDE